MNSRLVIDGHSHCGMDIFHGETNIDDYILFANKSMIDVGLIMPVPSPCKELGNIDSRNMRWEYQYDKITHYGIRNPFLELNYKLNDLLIQKSNDKLKLKCIPMFHPILDDIKLFEQMINDIDPVALKIHGIGSGVMSDDISQEFIRIIKKYELPLILHTDCDLGDNLDRSMIYVRNINNAKKWTEFLIQNEIFGTLNHGANLDLSTFDIVNNTPFVKVALGPDNVSCIDSNRLYIDCNGDYKKYLKILRDFLDVSKIIYDADFNWNKDGDCDSVSRIMELFSMDELDYIFSQNILNHYPKLKKSLR